MFVTKLYVPNATRKACTGQSVMEWAVWFREFYYMLCAASSPKKWSKVLMTWEDLRSPPLLLPSMPSVEGELGRRRRGKQCVSPRICPGAASAQLLISQEHSERIISASCLFGNHIYHADCGHTLAVPLFSLVKNQGQTSDVFAFRGGSVYSWDIRGVLITWL